jgi:hypothetical protein
VRVAVHHRDRYIKLGVRPLRGQLAMKHVQVVPLGATQCRRHVEPFADPVQRVDRWWGLLGGERDRVQVLQGPGQRDQVGRHGVGEVLPEGHHAPADHHRFADRRGGDRHAHRCQPPRDRQFVTDATHPPCVGHDLRHDRGVGQQHNCVLANPHHIGMTRIQPE